jgi:ATP-dependent protease ClpP protease subunit
MPGSGPSKEHRENPKRAVYLLGDINQALIEKLTPTINELRLSSSDPITAYVDSQGGDVWAAENIRSLLQAPNPDGVRCRLITVATGNAASAAADFLALGDYAIAYSHSYIIYHGTRRPSPAPLTVEGASSLASSLQQTNEFFAIRLAKRAFDRFVLRILLLGDEFQHYANANSQPLGSPDVAALVEALGRKLAPNKSALIQAAIQRQAAIDALTQSVRDHLAKDSRQDQLQGNRLEMEIWNAILTYKAALHASEEWRLSTQGLAEVSNDFYLLHDFHFGRQTQALDRLVNIYGKIFLATSELKEYETIPGADDDKRFTYLKHHAQPKIRPLWYFMVSLCRLMQSADYWFGPEEAYWIGLVDEIPGSDLPNQRQFVEGETQAT